MWGIGVKQGKYMKKDDPVKEEKYHNVKSVLLYLHDIVYLLGAVVIVLLVCFRVVVVSGDSMNQTLLDGDYLLLISSNLYGQPKQGDIIVASKDSFDNGDPIIKRVIATEGQVVDIDFGTGAVAVDGEILQENYINNLTTRPEGTEFPITVAPGCVFVMGDNRDRSQDSRSPEIGLIDSREILGKVLFLFFPGSDHGEMARDFSRIGGLS